MKNPINGNVFHWRDTTFTIAEDFSEVTIERAGIKVTVLSGALVDLLRVMEAELRESQNKELEGERFFNFTASTLSCPDGDWN